MWAREMVQVVGKSRQTRPAIFKRCWLVSKLELPSYVCHLDVTVVLDLIYDFVFLPFQVFLIYSFLLPVVIAGDSMAKS